MKNIKEVLESFYKLYLDGRKKKAPVSFIDFFEARTFLLESLDQAIKERDEEWIWRIEMLKDANSMLRSDYIQSLDDLINSMK